MDTRTKLKIAALALLNTITMYGGPLLLGYAVGTRRVWASLLGSALFMGGMVLARREESERRQQHDALVRIVNDYRSLVDALTETAPDTAERNVDG